MRFGADEHRALVWIADSATSDRVVAVVVAVAVVVSVAVVVVRSSGCACARRDHRG
jgi:hypothetical protein